MNLKNTEISAQKLALTGTQVHVLGPGLVLSECEIESDGDYNSIVIAGLKMNGGRFIQESTLANFHFEYAHFLNVKFSGRFEGCDFGNWEGVEQGSVVGCEFTDAILDGCRFLNCDVRGMKFPKWPGFAMINPAAASDYVATNHWPGKFGALMSIYVDNDIECVALCGDGERIATKYGLTLNELKKLLAPIPGMQILD